MSSAKTRDSFDLVDTNSKSHSCKITIHFEYFPSIIHWLKICWKGLVPMITIICWRSMYCQSLWTAWTIAKANLSMWEYYNSCPLRLFTHITYCMLLMWIVLLNQNHIDGWFRWYHVLDGTVYNMKSFL